MKLKTKNKIAKNKKIKKKEKRGTQKYANVVETRIEKRRKRKYFEIQSSISRLFYLFKRKKKEEYISFLEFYLAIYLFLPSKLSNLPESGEDLVIFPRP